MKKRDWFGAVLAFVPPICWGLWLLGLLVQAFTKRDEVEAESGEAVVDWVLFPAAIVVAASVIALVVFAVRTVLRYRALRRGVRRANAQLDYLRRDVLPGYFARMRSEGEELMGMGSSDLRARCTRMELRVKLCEAEEAYHGAEGYYNVRRRVDVTDESYAQRHMLLKRAGVEECMPYCDEVLARYERAWHVLQELERLCATSRDVLSAPGDAVATVAPPA